MYIRLNRQKLFSQLEDNTELVDCYVLMGDNPKLKDPIEVARYENGKVVTVSGRKEMADAATPKDDKTIYEEITITKNQVINEA